MENLKEPQGQGAAGVNGWMTVPAFGDWDMKNGALPDYSMDFSKIREMRKQNKKELSRASLGGDDDLLAHQQHKPAEAQAQPKLVNDHRRPLHGRDDSPTKTQSWPVAGIPSMIYGAPGTGDGLGWEMRDRPSLEW